MFVFSVLNPLVFAENLDYEELSQLHVNFASKYSYRENTAQKSFDLYDVNYASSIRYTKDGKQFECPDTYIDYQSNIKSQISDRKILIKAANKELAGILYNSVTLVPYNAISSIGYDSEFNRESLVCKISGNNAVVELMPDLIGMRKNEDSGYYVPLETCAKYIDDMLYVPVRAVADQLGLNILWDGETYTVTLEKYADNSTVPLLYVNKTPEQVTCNKFTLSGSVWDKSGKSYVYINGELIETAEINEEKNWEKNFDLVTGENKFDITVKNDNGYNFTETKTITYTPVSSEKTTEPPIFSSLEIQETTDKPQAHVSGIISNLDHGVTMTVNGNVVELFGEPYNMFNMTIPLDVGDNVYTFVLANNHGQTTEVTKTIRRTE